MDLEINWSQILHHLYHLAIAYALALPIGLDREKSARRFGLRTFPLVALGACAFMLTGTYVLDTTDAEARVIYGIITGIGFIGGGAILKDKGTVRGTATAASIWSTGAVGVAVAYNRFEIAIVLSLLNFLTLRFVKEFKENQSQND
jgi:putative Mg2+ transporter-C (MgtC) family protein